MQPKFLREAIREAHQSVTDGGGPFGAVLVLDNRIIGRGRNRVTLDNDPSAHAEVNAIRDACRRLDRFQLSGCTLYSSCQPCLMCLATSYWARLDRVYYAATAADSAAAGFDDQQIREQLCPLPDAEIPTPAYAVQQAAGMRKLAQEVFGAWYRGSDRVDY